MIKKITLTLFLLSLLTSCAKAPAPTATNTPVVPATATLQPTQISPTVSPASPTPDPATLNSSPACKDGAVLVADVT